MDRYLLSTVAVTNYYEDKFTYHLRMALTFSKNDK